VGGKDFGWATKKFGGRQLGGRQVLVGDKDFGWATRKFGGRRRNLVGDNLVGDSFGGRQF